MSTLVHLNATSAAVFVPADDTFQQHVQAVGNSVTYTDSDGKNPGEIKDGDRKTFKAAHYFDATKPASILVVEEQVKPVREVVYVEPEADDASKADKDVRKKALKKDEPENPPFRPQKGKRQARGL